MFQSLKSPIRTRPARPTARYIRPVARASDNAHRARTVDPDLVRRRAAPGRRERGAHPPEILLDRAGRCRAPARCNRPRNRSRCRGLTDAGLLIGGDRVRVASVRRRNAPAGATVFPDRHQLHAVRRDLRASCADRPASATAGCGSIGQQNGGRCPSAPAPHRGCRSPGRCRAPAHKQRRGERARRLVAWRRRPKKTAAARTPAFSSPVSPGPPFHPGGAVPARPRSASKIRTRQHAPA